MTKFDHIGALTLGAFEKYVHWVKASGHLATPKQFNAVKEKLLLPEDTLLLNSIWTAYHHGIPSIDPEINVFVSSLNFGVLSEIIEIYKPILEPELIVDIYAQATKVMEEASFFTCARNLLDAAVSLFDARNKDLPDSNHVCLAFPDMPGLDPILNQALHCVRQYMVYGGSIGSLMTKRTDTQKIYNYPIYGSDNMLPVIITEPGSIYLLGKPPRKDVAANHLKSV